MSRIAKEPVALPSDVKAEFKEGQLLVSGPKGSLNLSIPENIGLEVDKDAIKVRKNEENKPSGSDANGMIKQEEKVKLSIPAGVEEGMQLKVGGKGNEAPFEGVNGDIIVLIEVEDHSELVRDGQNIHFDHYVSYPEAVLGTNAEITTLTGKVRVKLEPGIQSGKILRLKGKGLPSVNNYAKGDMLVHINIWTPQVLDKEEKEFFKNKLNSDNFTPNPTKTDKSFFDRVKEMFR